MSKKSLQRKRVLIFQQRGWGIRVGHFLAKKLQAEGCALAAITIKKSVHQFVINQSEVSYEHVYSYDDSKDNPKAYLGQDDYSLKEICDELGIDSVWPLSQTLREYKFLHLVRTFSILEPK